MRRRDFLRCGTAAGAAMLGLQRFPHHLYAADTAKTAQDLVTLGRTGITVTRLAQGTGTNGVGRSSNQKRAMGEQGLSDLLVRGVDNGVRFWDLADQYGSHPNAKAALRTVKRDDVVILTKTHARTAAEMRADLDRFRAEIGTERIDIVLLHCMLSAKWPEERAGAMDILSEAKQKGIIRAHGVSCHDFGALGVAAESDWVDVDLARLNPGSVAMDSDPASVVGVLKTMKAKGKGIVGMKILGAGAFRKKPDEALQYALGQDVLDCFTIGCENPNEFQDLLKRIPAASTRG
jgi:aryl-alcohol dehydrogenase-like predicted oxidoreductase